MKDTQIIDLFWARSEDAIAQTAQKYGGYCHTIAFNILRNQEDSEECVNDTYWKAWGLLPPRRPQRLATFLGKITRNLSLDRYRHLSADKRGGGQVTLALEELSACIPSCDDTDGIVEEMVLTQLLNRFLAGLSAEHRKIFMQRYWYLSTVKDIAGDLGITESKVKMVLMRTRNALREKLEEEGIAL